jgi:hypothetical protein
MRPALAGFVGHRLPLTRLSAKIICKYLESVNPVKLTKRNKAITFIVYRLRSACEILLKVDYRNPRVGDSV